MLKINSCRYYFNNKRAIKHFNIIKYVRPSVCMSAVGLVNTSQCTTVTGGSASVNVKAATVSLSFAWKILPVPTVFAKPISPSSWEWRFSLPAAQPVRLSVWLVGTLAGWLTERRQVRSFQNRKPHIFFFFIFIFIFLFFSFILIFIFLFFYFDFILFCFPLRCLLYFDFYLFLLTFISFHFYLAFCRKLVAFVFVRSI